MGNNKVTEDPRIDPRIRALFGVVELPDELLGDADSREQLLKEANTDEAIAQRQAFAIIQEMCDTEELAPSAGLVVTEHTVVSAPDGNTVKLRFIRPEGEAPLPCVYYIHGGGMANMSCYDGNYRAWGKILAAQGEDFPEGVRAFLEKRDPVYGPKG